MILYWAGSRLSVQALIINSYVWWHWERATTQQQKQADWECLDPGLLDAVSKNTATDLRKKMMMMTTILPKKSILCYTHRCDTLRSSQGLRRREGRSWNWGSVIHLCVVVVFIHRVLSLLSPRHLLLLLFAWPDWVLLLLCKIWADKPCKSSGIQTCSDLPYSLLPHKCLCVRTLIESTSPTVSVLPYRLSVELYRRICRIRATIVELQNAKQVRGKELH